MLTAYGLGIEANLNQMDQPHQLPTRNIALELVRVTEAAALAAGRHVGRGEKESADGAAVDAMRVVLNTIPISGRVIIGEGEKDNAPMLFNGEEVGSGGPEFDIAVDPVDGTTLTANGLDNAIAVIAIADKGSMFDPGPIMYMDKIAVGPRAKGLIDMNLSVKENLLLVSKANETDISELTVVILDRPRHENLIEQVRLAGARIKLIRDGDVAGAIAAARRGSGVDVLMGIGGTPEAVIAAAAIKCMGGEILGRLYPRDETEKQKAIELGFDLDKVLTTNDLVAGDNIFFSATGITNGDLLPGVRYDQISAHTTSLSMRSKSGTVRVVEAEHNLHKLRSLSVVEY
ncbi:MAG TPA: class II fructose-bisphosphatase [Acidimicrobiia bacterium]|nr:class II fructose-bisphosphatase [Acidimicrobiia bacterium]